MNTPAQSNSSHFPRAALAAQLANDLQGANPFSDAPNGLFLAAPRREGKSVFLQEDLRPALQAAGVVVIYVDLWANKEKDPSLVIAQTIGAELFRHLGAVAKAAHAVGLESVTVAGVLKMDAKKIGQPDGATLKDALALLIAEAGKPVALLVDEAQHVLTSKAGEITMAALKSARDTINNSAGHRLMLVMTGSDRDKLMRLVNSTSAAFYGSHIHKLPPLGSDYVAYVAKQLESSYTNLQPINATLLEDAFDLLGHRPQFFKNAVSYGLNPLESTGKRLEDAVLEFARQQRRNDQAQMESDFMGLRDIERLVLWRILVTGDKFRPYDNGALAFYTQRCGQPVTAQQVQAALVSLRNREPCIIWKSERGDYALDNSQMQDWYRMLNDAGRWPPDPDLEEVEKSVVNPFEIDSPS